MACQQPLVVMTAKTMCSTIITCQYLVHRSQDNLRHPAPVHSDLAVGVEGKYRSFVAKRVDGVVPILLSHFGFAKEPQSSHATPGLQIRCVVAEKRTSAISHKTITKMAYRTTPR